jgi:hypothetical protein
MMLSISGVLIRMECIIASLDYQSKWVGEAPFDILYLQAK